MQAILTSQREIHHAAIPELSAYDAGADDRPALILVDDNPDIAAILSRLLRDLLPDYAIVAVTDGAEAMFQLERRAVQLVITDFNMPDMNGLLLTTRIKERSPHTPVLLITAYATPILDTLMQQRHVDYYLAKPFRLSDLEYLVLAALDPRAVTTNSTT